MGVAPKLFCAGECINAGLFPPTEFVTDPMRFAMVSPAKGDNKFIADFASERSRLGESQVVRIRGLAAADEARRLGDRSDIIRSRIRRGSGAASTLFSIAFVLDRLADLPSGTGFCRIPVVCRGFRGGPELRPKRRLHLLRIGCSQIILVAQAAVRPHGRFVRRAKIVEFDEQ